MPTIFDGDEQAHLLDREKALFDNKTWPPLRSPLGRPRPSPDANSGTRSPTSQGVGGCRDRAPAPARRETEAPASMFLGRLLFQDANLKIESQILGFGMRARAYGEPRRLGLREARSTNCSARERATISSCILEEVGPRLCLSVGPKVRACFRVDEPGVDPASDCRSRWTEPFENVADAKFPTDRPGVDSLPLKVKAVLRAITKVPRRREIAGGEMFRPAASAK